MPFFAPPPQSAEVRQASQADLKKLQDMAATAKRLEDQRRRDQALADAKADQRAKALGTNQRK